MLSLANAFDQDDLNNFEKNYELSKSKRLFRN